MDRHRLPILLLLVFAGSAIASTWTTYGPGGMGSVRALATDPSSPGTIYAGTGVLFKSTDNGRTWRQLDYGSSGAIRNILVDPHNPAIVYVGVQDCLTGFKIGSAAQGCSVYKSINGGATFEPANNGLGALNELFSLVIDPSTPSVLYENALFYGVYRTVDGGKNWTHMASSRHVLAVDPKNSAILYGHDWRTGHLVKSLDSGSTWTILLIEGDYMQPTIDPSNPNVLLAQGIAGLSLSKDGGLTWLLISQVKAGISSIQFDPSDSMTIYASYHTESGGFFFSRDGGSSWFEANEGLPSRDITSLAVSPDGKSLYAGIGWIGDVYVRTTEDLQPSALLLLNRIRVQVIWKDASGRTGIGRPVPILVPDYAFPSSGIFTFFSPDNAEILVKVVGACHLTDYRAIWVFISAATNQEYAVTVTDTVTGRTKLYTNPLGVVPVPVMDLTAFPCL